MADDWATFGAAPPSVAGTDLHLDLTGPGLRAGLMDALREAVRTGRLAPGTRLPSSRSLAADLGIARNTVADAYAELVAEGWLIAQQGSGTRVARRAEPRTAAPAAPRTRPTPRRPAYGLLPGSPNLAEFPRTQWLAAARRALTAAPHDAFGYGDALGRVELRTVLADYLARARGVYAEPERIVICSGFHHGLMLMAQALRARRVRAVAVESYGFDVYRDLLTSAGLRTPPLYVDESGARTDDLARLRGVGAVLMTPAHQYPTGVELRPDRRAAAVDWARATGGLILEDDYDGEFRYDRQPVGALQGLDPRAGGVLRLGEQVAGAGAAARLDGAARGTGAGDRGGQGLRRMVKRAGPADTRGVHRLGRVRPSCALDAAALPAPPRPAGRGPGAEGPRHPRDRHGRRAASGPRTPARDRALGRAGGGPPGPGGQRDGRVPLRSGGLRVAVARAGRAGGRLRGSLGQRVGGRAGRTVQGDAVDGALP